MGLVRLLQISDLHLGRPFGWLPADRRDERRRDQIGTLERAVRTAIERGAHAILIPGDLFDVEGVDASTLASAISSFDIAGCPPVFIAPGNHDPFWPRCLHWNARLLRLRDREWPAHVHVFTSESWAAQPLPNFQAVRVWGRSFTSNAVSLDRPLAPERLREIPPPDPERVEIALFHGAREDVVPPGQTVTAPFSDAEVLASPFTYLAAGHYHAATAITANDGVAAGVRLAYAGSAVALDVSESGVHGALEVRIEHGRRLPFVETEFVPLDSRRVHDLTVDVTRCASAEQVDRRIEKALDDANAAEADLARVRLTGRLAKDVRYRPSPRLQDRLFHLRIDVRRLRPDYDLEAYLDHDPVTTEERFARSLVERLHQEKDPAQRALLESALYYGLDAFRLHEVTPAYEELGE